VKRRFDVAYDGPSSEDIERFDEGDAYCPDCGEHVYDDAVICPHCGSDIAGRTTLRPPEAAKMAQRSMIVLVIVIIAVLSGLAGLLRVFG
jgi:uncharacterized membrane protein YvbJ